MSGIGQEKSGQMPASPVIPVTPQGARPMPPPAPRQERTYGSNSDLQFDMMGRLPTGFAEGKNATGMQRRSENLGDVPNLDNLGGEPAPGFSINFDKIAGSMAKPRTRDDTLDIPNPDFGGMEIDMGMGMLGGGRPMSKGRKKKGDVFRMF